MMWQPKTAVGFLVAIAIVMAAAVGAAGEATPTPTPTPRPAGGKSLSEVAKEKELKKGESGKSIVITNENLADYAEKGKVTSVEKGDQNADRRPVRNPAANPNLTVVGPTDPTHSDERERYWVGLYQRQLELVASIKYQIQILDEEIPGLWTQFYSVDDPAYREGVVKPKLDASLERRDRLVEQLKEEEPRLVEIKTQARRAGAEPGWFRGISAPTPRPSTPTPKIVID